MRRRIELLQELVVESQYVVDPASVADAIIVRAMARRLIPGTTFRNENRIPETRSFRPSRQARSFRPCSTPRARVI